MIVSEGYTAEYYRSQNRIVVTLPQTMETMTNTVTSISDRKTTVTDDELSVILTVVKKMMEVEHDEP